MSVNLGDVVVRVDLTGWAVASELHVVLEWLWVPSIDREPRSLRPALRHHNQLLGQHHAASAILDAEILDQLPRLCWVDEAVSDQSILVPDHRLELKLKLSDDDTVHDHLRLLVTDREDHHLRISIDQLLTLHQINKPCLAKHHRFLCSECLENVLLTCLTYKVHYLLQVSVDLLEVLFGNDCELVLDLSVHTSTSMV